MIQKRMLLTVAAFLLILTVIVVGPKIKHNKDWPRFRTATAAETLAPQIGYPTYDDYWLLVRVISGEAHSEPYVGQVGVGAVILNRVKSPLFPQSVSEVVFEPDAFESVSNGIMWSLPPSDENMTAAQAALDGWDPTYGALFFWNPAKDVSPWIWSRNIVTAIGRHVFGH
ncbi:MAG TPA: spore cortex-lytic protein [Firmicutes bacterium]|jgi:N-acetylmuramoyl-L-alanine amidase|nr:spore cortex-lytic protein [Bacillota bacterium]